MGNDMPGLVTLYTSRVGNDMFRFLWFAFVSHVNLGVNLSFLAVMYFFS